MEDESGGELTSSSDTDSSMDDLNDESTSVDHYESIRAEAEKNLSNVGCLVDADPEKIKKEDFETAFTAESKKALEETLAEVNLGFDLSDFQSVAINALLNRRDVICIQPTGMVLDIWYQIIRLCPM